MRVFLIFSLSHRARKLTLVGARFPLCQECMCAQKFCGLLPCNRPTIQLQQRDREEYKERMTVQTMRMQRDEEEKSQTMCPES